MVVVARPLVLQLAHVWLVPMKPVAALVIGRAPVICVQFSADRPKFPEPGLSIPDRRCTRLRPVSGCMVLLRPLGHVRVRADDRAFLFRPVHARLQTVDTGDVGVVKKELPLIARELAN